MFFYDGLVLAICTAIFNLGWLQKKTRNHKDN